MLFGFLTKDIIKRIDALQTQLNRRLKEMETNMASELETLTAKVEEARGTMASAAVLIRGFKAALDAAIAAGNPQALLDLSASLDEKEDELAAAVAENPLP